MMEQAYKTLASLITIKPQQVLNRTAIYLNQPEAHVEKFLLALASGKLFENQSDAIAKFINYMVDHRSCRLSPQYFSCRQNIQLLACSENKIYTFDSSQHRAYCVYGKAVSLLRRKGKDTTDPERNTLVSQLQNVIYQLYQQDLYPLAKSQSRQIDDILLHFNLPDQDFSAVFLSNEVYSPFVPQPYALVIILATPSPKPEQLQNFLKQTLLHIYFQQASLLNKIMYRQNFYKNSGLRGVYFIEQGQVVSTGGRIVARGWVTNGKCRSSGYGWKFKPLPFFKAIAKNQHIWKQFTNDLALNQEYPFKIAYLLGLEEDPLIPQRTIKRGFFKLPRIGNSSIDYGKITAIDKVRHYDDKISDICEYKQRLLTRKLGPTRAFNNIMGMDSQKQKQHQRLMLRHQSSSRQIIHKSLNSSTQNILIMSVLKKLEGLTEQGVPLQQRIERRDKIRISPVFLNQKSRVMKKKRYNQ